MADSVVEIVNTTVTEADFSGGYDVITTDAGTSYVIKDVQVQNGYLSSVPATINNMPVGNFSESLTGSEVIDVNSTLNITAVGYPLAYNNLSVITRHTSGQLYINQASVGDTLGVNTKVIDSNNVFTAGSITRANMIMQSGDSYYVLYRDGNSTTYARYHATSSSSLTNLATSSYNPIALAPDLGAIIYFIGSNLYKHTPSGGQELIRSSSPYTSFSSYSRGYYQNGYFFWQESTSAGAYVRAINVATGTAFNINMGGTSPQYSNGWQFCVSYDQPSDLFTIYWKDDADASNYYLRKFVMNFTKTQMDAYTGNGAHALSAYLLESKSTSTLPTDYYANAGQYGAGRLEGHPTDGNLILYTSYSGSSSNAVQGKTYNMSNAKDSILIELGVSRLDTSGDYSYFYKLYTPSAAEVAVTNYDPPLDYRLRITGVKTTTA